ncbi:MAG: hypothetical protein C4326_14500 [Ignavibacteria bacterium]
MVAPSPRIAFDRLRTQARYPFPRQACNHLNHLATFLSLLPFEFGGRDPNPVPTQITIGTAGRVWRLDLQQDILLHFMLAMISTRINPPRCEEKQNDTCLAHFAVKKNREPR